MHGIEGGGRLNSLIITGLSVRERAAVANASVCVRVVGVGVCVFNERFWSGALPSPPIPNVYLEFVFGAGGIIEQPCHRRSVFCVCVLFLHSIDDS